MKVFPPFRGYILILFCFGIQLLQAQIDTFKLDAVVVTSYKEVNTKQTSIHIEPISLETIIRSGAFNLSDAMAKIPGISQLSTGVAISKPVIHGLYGNRVLVLFSGLRFDNQQWQDEHGLGLSDIGISKAEIIKGPYSVLYGTEAVAGVINIIEEEKAKAGTRQSDLGIKLNSNTLGGTLQYGYKINFGEKWLRFRAGYESNADYADGNNTRILNSRFDGYYFKGSYGFRKKNWLSENNYNFSLNRFGFIFSDISDFFESPDARWSRSFPGPHHIVVLNILSSENTFILERSSLKLNAGIQSNQRMEDEGGGAISLNMALITGEYTLRWNKQLSAKNEVVLANITSIENNTNYGKRRIIPDAWMSETGISGLLKHHFNNSVMEIGAGFGGKYIKTLPTAGVNSEEKIIDPFQIFRPFFNGTAGISLNPNTDLNLKFNVSSGVRSPNLAELSSNGLHEGVFTYEIGDPTLSSEQNLNGDISVNANFGDFHIYGSVFYNYFHNYIYLAPTSEEWFGFPIYRFKQQDATLYGGETTLDIAPALIKNCKLSISYSGMIGNTVDGKYLPFIPAQKIRPELRFEKNKIRKTENDFIFINCDIVCGQNNIAQEETVTPSYELLNAGLGCTINTNKFPIVLSLSGNNLLNEVYYDHLSRFKPLGLNNIGMNIAINCKILFTKQIKTKLYEK
jgi:iron complex outermembrane receptor protein